MNETATLGCLVGGGNPAHCNDPTILLHDQYQQPHLDGGDVLRLHALLALGRLVGDLLALFEGLEPAATYSGVVHEVDLTRLHGPIRVKRSGSVKGVKVDGQKRQTLFA